MLPRGYCTDAKHGGLTQVFLDKMHVKQTEKCKLLQLEPSLMTGSENETMSSVFAFKNLYLTELIHTID